MKIGEQFFITENARCLLGLPDAVIFTLVDILEDGATRPFVLKSDELGEDWVNFFLEEELIKLP